jgi:uncharacterized protein (TIGR03089 family)
VPEQTTPDELLRAELARDAARPLLTYYDDATGERIELSVATFANWVAKTAGLLQDGLSAEPGDRVALQLPAHWQALVWASACWAVGAAVGVDKAESPAVAVAGPQTVEDADAPEVVALSLRPLGGPFTTPLPAGVLDYAIEVPVYPDHFVALSTPRPADPGLGDETLAALVSATRARADSLGLSDSARVLVPTDDLSTAIRNALLLPLTVGGSAALVRNEDRSGRAARVEAERVTNVVSA